MGLRLCTTEPLDATTGCQHYDGVIRWNILLLEIREAMVGLRCHACNTELLPGAKFCRRCGVEFSEVSTDASERPTAILPTVEGATTQRLQARATAPAPVLKQKSGGRRLLIVGVIALLIIGIISAVAIRRQRNLTVNQAQLIYPGARTVLDLRNSDGSRTVHLQTSDPLNKVETWYQSNLSLTKTTRLTTNSYVLKNDVATITLVAEENTTNILIKQAP